MPDNRFFDLLFDRKAMRLRYPSRDRALQEYLRDVRARLVPLKAEEEARLLSRAQSGDTLALERLVEANLRLVVAVASKYQGLGLPMLDLIAEGNIGLLKAIERFNPGKARRLSTYSKYWIIKYLTEALAKQARTIRLSSTGTERMNKIQKSIVDFLQHGVEPTVQDLVFATQLAREDVVELLALLQEPLSLERTEAETDPLWEVLKAPPLVLSDQAPAPPAPFGDVRELIGQLLSPQERMAVELRFGLYDGIVYDYDEIGLKIFGDRLIAPNERARQLEQSALGKLRQAFEQNEEG